MPFDDQWRKRKRRPESRLDEFVKSARLMRGLTQDQVARQIGATGGYISKLENGQIKQPAYHYILPLAGVLNIPYAELMELATGSATTEALPYSPEVMAFAAWLDRFPAELRDQIIKSAHAIARTLPGYDEYAEGEGE